MAGKSASAFDVRVGERLRAARMAAGVSQAELGRLLGVSFQQIQRYERGVNRLPSYAFVALEARLGLAPASLLSDADKDGVVDEKNAFWATPGALELSRIYVELSVLRRRRLIAVARELRSRDEDVQPRST